LRTYYKYYISFTSTKSFIDGLQKYFNVELDITKKKIQTRHPSRLNNIRTLSIGGNLQVEKILYHIYNDSTIYLDRKYNKYMYLKKLNELKYK